MNRRLYWLLLALCCIFIVLPASSCGPDFPDAVFTRQHGPDDFAAYAAGKLGVPQTGYYTRSLAIAYDWLTGRALSPDDQAQAVQVNADMLAQDGVSSSPVADIPQGFTNWIKARAAFGPVDGFLPAATMDTFAGVNGQPYENFPNCLDDGFATAATTMAARISAHGAKDPGVIDWVRGQDAVFANCPGGNPSSATPTSASHLPPSAASGPAWLQQDRAYQTAAANFYAENFDAAITGFRAIAADTSSPWSIVSRYLIARALIRKTTLADNEIGGPASSDPAQVAADAAKLKAGLASAQKELLAMRSDPRMAPMSNAIDALLDYVNIRLHPDAQAVVLAARVHTPGAPRFGQALTDLTYLRVNPEVGTREFTPAAVAADKTGLLDWMNTFPTDDKAHALDQWHLTHQRVWLMDAMAGTNAGDRQAAELLAAAAAVPASDPAWTAITYYRLQLLPSGAARTALLAVLPTVQQSNTASTLNLFAELNAKTSPDLNTWLGQIGRIPASETSWGDENGGLATQLQDEPCGPKLPETEVHLFTDDGAGTLNTLMPVSLLATAAESNVLPPNLRFALAESTWARAVMLDQPAIAARMTPILVGCRAAWKPVLAAYDGAKTPSDRKAEGLLALMRFASTEPDVRAGEERSDGFATYSEFRDNWWCTVPPAESGDIPMSATPPPALDIAVPAFLTKAQQSAGQAELKTLQQGGSASTYFATQALAWYKAHPKDPRTLDIVGEANRVLRNGCRDDKLTPPLAHALFDALHQSFPTSDWTKKYPTWE